MGMPDASEQIHHEGVSTGGGAAHHVFTGIANPGAGSATLSDALQATITDGLMG